MPPSAPSPSGAARPRGPGEVAAPRGGTPYKGLSSSEAPEEEGRCSRSLSHAGSDGPRSPLPPAPSAPRAPRPPRAGRASAAARRDPDPESGPSGPRGPGPGSSRLGPRCHPAPLRSPPAPVVPQVPSASHPPSLPPSHCAREEMGHWARRPRAPQERASLQGTGRARGRWQGAEPGVRAAASVRPTPAPATWGVGAFLCCPGRPRGSLGGRGAFKPPTTCWAGSARLGLGGPRGEPSTGGPGVLPAPRQPGTGPSRGMWPIGGAPAFAPGHTPAPAPMERRSPGTSSPGPHWLRTVPGGHSRSARTTSCSRGPSSPDSNAVAGSRAPTWPTSRQTARHPMSGGPLRPGAPTALGADGRSRVKQGRQPPGTALPSSGIPAAPGLGAVPRRRLRSWRPSALLRLPGPGRRLRGGRVARRPHLLSLRAARDCGGGAGVASAPAPGASGFRWRPLSAARLHANGPPLPAFFWPGWEPPADHDWVQPAVREGAWPRPGTADRVGTSALALPGPLPLPQAYFLCRLSTALQPRALTREYAGAPCARLTPGPTQAQARRAGPAGRRGLEGSPPPQAATGTPWTAEESPDAPGGWRGGRAHAGRRPHAGLGPLPAPTGTPSALQGCPLLGCPRPPGPVPHFLPGAVESGAGRGGTGGRGGCCPGLGPAAPRARSRDRGPFALRRRRGRPGAAGERGVRRGQGAAGTVGARVTQGARAAPSASVLRRFPVLAGFCRFDLRRSPPPPSRPRHASR
ncbi:collagen alpha-1(I) chain-like [Canis lupus familiaris]|uniref:collagen alpha-1(I) chain-like n=1 Tax=Canis lupus familiaris TaxID=9615 RepID=UPI0006B3CD2D|nr:collagen alpha-1(I) chain-like [Canis lupus familiaris]|eukprot:XP_013966893.1 collagen alpha-1(I) chain-like [Canis lupus familiaris]